MDGWREQRAAFTAVEKKRGKKHISFVYNKATFQKVVRERLFYMGRRRREKMELLLGQLLRKLAKHR